MRLDTEFLKERLESLGGARGGRVLVAYSGGLDSTVLLHLASRIEGFQPLLAVHVDHGLHADSARWAASAQAYAATLNLPFLGLQANVADRGTGLEAAARDARYAAFESVLKEGDWLLSAHHADDQGETLLLNLLRGSGPLGLSGMSGARRCGRGLLLRPFLDVTRSELERYAKAAGLTWSEDPSNEDSRFDRNFLRQTIVPLLRERWPAVSRRLNASALLSADASAMLDELAAQDLASAGAANRIDIASLRNLTPARQSNLLRYAARQRQLPALPASRTREILLSLATARDDAAPLVTWDNAEARRYRGELFIQRAAGAIECMGMTLRPGQRAELGNSLGALCLERTESSGIAAEVAEAGLEIAVREGGERIRPVAGGPTRTLKYLLQSAGILPWMRARLPLLKSGDRVIAVGDLWTESTACESPGFRVRWDGRPELT